MEDTAALVEPRGNDPGILPRSVTAGAAGVVAGLAAYYRANSLGTARPDALYRVIIQHSMPNVIKDVLNGTLTGSSSRQVASAGGRCAGGGERGPVPDARRGGPRRAAVVDLFREPRRACRGSGRPGCGALGACACSARTRGGLVDLQLEDDLAEHRQAEDRFGAGRPPTVPGSSHIVLLAACRSGAAARRSSVRIIRIRGPIGRGSSGRLMSVRARLWTGRWRILRGPGAGLRWGGRWCGRRRWPGGQVFSQASGLAGLRLSHTDPSALGYCPGSHTR